MRARWRYRRDVDGFVIVAARAHDIEGVRAGQIEVPRGPTSARPDPPTVAPFDSHGGQEGASRARRASAAHHLIHHQPHDTAVEARPRRLDELIPLSGHHLAPSAVGHVGRSGRSGPPLPPPGPRGQPFVLRRAVNTIGGRHESHEIQSDGDTPPPSSGSSTGISIAKSWVIKGVTNAESRRGSPRCAGVLGGIVRPRRRWLDVIAETRIRNRFLQQLRSPLPCICRPIRRAIVAGGSHTGSRPPRSPASAQVTASRRCRRRRPPRLADSQVPSAASRDRQCGDMRFPL